MAEAVEECGEFPPADCSGCIDGPPRVGCDQGICIALHDAQCGVDDLHCGQLDVDWTFGPRCVQFRCTECPCPTGYGCEEREEKCVELDSCEAPRDCAGAAAEGEVPLGA